MDWKPKPLPKSRTKRRKPLVTVSWPPGLHCPGDSGWQLYDVRSACLGDHANCYSCHGMRRRVGPPTLRCLFLLSGARGDGQSSSATQLEQVGVTAEDSTSDEIQTRTQDDFKHAIGPVRPVMCRYFSFASQLTVRLYRVTVSSFLIKACGWVQNDIRSQILGSVH